ncbi:glycerol-3-phosphate 1-O-acyltransferase PlsY [Pseudothermotoga thermarum]|uniref:Glycerol-3-phosphate acyltransferase n=1 Tax=Pseudothermotoga thermarum DSM 5069 TaxID=688269 RepID=F7YVB5_9THEM|nr:glycerol-3-phosphate 1-O-acyltransferase PlsY [Pseudothermotoga thermarum]AEH50418.1 acyl-phosphate glycerol-3-phosphate acyltransferase [Pseudothermotoga thermarum DSM 5069]
MIHLLAGLICYLCGSIPFSYLLPKLKKIDVRTVGSGNVGGTNALRAAGPVIGFSCMILDALKAFIPVLVFSKLSGMDPKVVGIAAIAAVLGHDFPIFLKFKGGKGVASTTGVMFAICYPCGFVFLAVWLLIVLTTKFVSLGSIIGLYTASLVGFFFNTNFGVLFLILATISTVRHSDNVERLLHGTERKTDLLAFLKKRRPS